MTVLLVRVIAWAILAGLVGVLVVVPLLIWRAEKRPANEPLSKRSPGHAKAAVDLADLEITLGLMTEAELDLHLEQLARSLPH